MVCYAKGLPTPPKDALPPDRGTHQKYVWQLHNYLFSIAQSPHAFKATVEERREASFGDLTEAVPGLRTQPGVVGNFIPRSGGRPTIDGRWQEG